MSALRSVMLVMTNVDGNNNKYWKAEILDNNSFNVTNGRIGGKGQSQPTKCFPSYDAADRMLEKKMKEKLKKGYVHFDGVTDIGNSVGTTRVALEQVAIDQIRTKSDPSIICDLVKTLVQKNIHSILSKTDLQYDDESGLFRTPLGYVTKASITKARNFLSKIEPFINNNDFDNLAAKQMLSEYLMLIPQKVSAKLSVKGVLPNTNAILSQNSILDDLESSIEQVDAGFFDNKKDKSNEPITERLFNAELSLVSDNTIIDSINRFYNQTRKASHASHHLTVKRVFEVSIDEMTSNYNSNGEPIGNIKQLWHGTRIGNILSILRSGFIIPPSNAAHVTGRMYGNGLYFSDQSTKSLNYAYGYWDGGSKDNTCYMFLCDVAMGKEHKPRSWNANFPIKGYDSTFAIGGKSGVVNNEMIIYKTFQSVPRYLVEFG